MLSAIASEYFSHSPFLVLPLVAMGIFLTLFVVMGLRATRLRGRDAERMARLPLEADDE